MLFRSAPITKGLETKILSQVFQLIMNELAERKIIYKGILYAGLMIKDGEIKVLEFNCRFGDPEAQPILALLENDLIDVMEACISGTLDNIELKWKNASACCVVIAAGGYPGKYDKGKEIFGIKEAGLIEKVTVFQAGTIKQNEITVTNGGRVLGVTGVGSSITEAIETVYKGVSKIRFVGIQLRKDSRKKELT